MFGVSTLVHALGLSGLFIARAFAPLFVLALTTRFVMHDPRALQWGLAPLTSATLPWFVSDELLIGCGVLAALESVAHHAAGARAVLRRRDGLLKAGAAVLAAVGLGVARDRGQLEALLEGSAALALASDPRVRGTLEPVLISLVIFIVVLGLARLHRGVLQRLAEQERDDPLGVGWLMTWVEELWSVVGALSLIALPEAALVGLAVWLLVQLRLRSVLKVRDDDDKVICVCGQRNYLTAPRCAHCGGRNASPSCVGAFGQSTPAFATDLEAHAQALFEVRRCPRCATPLEAREPQQFCTACGQAAPPDAVFVGEYDRMVRKRKAWALLGTALWGALPLIGLIPGIFIAHRRLTAPYARYVTRLRSWLVRILLRLAWLIVIVAQLVPGVGILGLPLMAYASHRAYRGTFLRANMATGSDEDDW